MVKTRFGVSIAAVFVAVGLSVLSIANVQGSSPEGVRDMRIIQSTPTATDPEEQPTAEELAAHKELVKQVVDVLNTGDYAVLDQIVAEDYAQHGAGRPSTRKGLQATYAGYRAAFPDIKWTIEFIGADGDKVFIYTSLTGTQTGSFNGIPATGKFVTINTADVYQIKDGMIAAHWDVYDQFGLLTQLGVIAPPGK